MTTDQLDFFRGQRDMFGGLDNVMGRLLREKNVDVIVTTMGEGSWVPERVTMNDQTAKPLKAHIDECGGNEFEVIDSHYMDGRIAQSRYTCCNCRQVITGDLE